MTRKTKIMKTSITLAISLTFLMITAASVSADRGDENQIIIDDEIPIDDSTSSDDLKEDMVISPGPDEPLIIAPNPDTTIEETDGLVVIAGETAEKIEISTMVLQGLIVIIVIASLVASLIIIKRQK